MPDGRGSEARTAFRREGPCHRIVERSLVLRFHRPLTDELRRTCRGIVRKDLVEPGPNVKLLVHALENWMLGGVRNDPDIGARVMTIRGMAMSPPSRRGAEREFSERVPALRRVAFWIIK